MCGVIESIWQIGHTDKTSGSRTCEVGKCNGASARIRPVDEGIGDGMEDPCAYIGTGASWQVTWIFVQYCLSEELTGPLGCLCREGTSV